MNCVRFQVLTAASMMFRIVFWYVLPCKMIVDRRFRGHVKQCHFSLLSFLKETCKLMRSSSCLYLCPLSTFEPLIDFYEIQTTHEPLHIDK
jgi:hypothetical protein